MPEPIESFKVMNSNQRRHFEKRYWGDVMFTAMLDPDGEPVVRMFHNDNDADIIYYFGPFDSMDVAETMAGTMTDTYNGQYWDVEGPFEMQEEESEKDEESDDPV